MNKINIQQNLCKKTSHDLRKYKIFFQFADVVNLKTAFEKKMLYSIAIFQKTKHK